MPPRRSTRSTSLGTAPIESLPIKRKRKRGQSIEPDNEEEKSLFDPPPMPKLSTHAEEEEERSLFDPPPMPELSTPLQPIPEEPVGPKSRLVIHKLALVNFKSYAGRQEIGPFHKVI